MTQTSNSTETMDRLPGMEDLRRKIPVDHLSDHGTGWGVNWFDIHFSEDAARTHRKEFAALRKEFEMYRQTHHVEGRNSTKGSCWRFSSDMLVRFADWMEFQSPLDTLMECAKEEGKVRRERKEREREEQHRRWDQERRSHRIICPNPCKIRISKFECIGGEGPFDSVLNERPGLYNSQPLHRFSLQFCEGTTQNEIDAWRHLAKVLEEERVKRTIVTRRTNSVEGSGCQWRLHEYVLLAYSDWLALDDNIEILIAHAIEKRKEEELRHEELRDREWDQRSFLPRGETGISKAFTLFNLDSSATLDDVKKRYRVLSKLYHPDAGGGEEEFKRLNSANQFLMQHIG